MFLSTKGKEKFQCSPRLKWEKEYATMQGQELGFDGPWGPFQLRRFYDSMFEGSIPSFLHPNRIRGDAAMGIYTVGSCPSKKQSVEWEHLMMSCSLAASSATWIALHAKGPVLGTICRKCQCLSTVLCLGIQHSNISFCLVLQPVPGCHLHLLREEDSLWPTVSISKRPPCPGS